MQPTMEILEKIKQNSAKNKDEVFTRLYRYMLRPDLYYAAYKNLYANNGAATKGVNNDTADSFGEDKIMGIIQSLSDESYIPSPVRRTHIKKANGKMRPLGIPTFTDKLIQEVLRMILESVYEPVFSDCSHGFRPNRSCHTALTKIKAQFPGMRWFVEGDIKGCFDNIDHQVLVNIINTKIKDARLIKLVFKMLKAGYLEDWKYHNTYSGTPQGGIISPIFSNIYLNELDKFAESMMNDFDKPRPQRLTPEYDALQKELKRVKYRLKTAKDEEKSVLLKLRKSLRSELVKTPCTAQTDKRIKYIRYADDFIIGVKGSKEDCIDIKAKFSEFIKNSLKMELSEEKTLITHSSAKARFLGYDIQVRRNGKIKPSKNHTQRTLNNQVDLSIPLDEKIMKFLFDKKIITQQKDGEIRTASRRALLRCTEFEIVSAYNSELRGLCNYYSIASNFVRLNYFAYLMEYSCLKTIANKHKSTTKKIVDKYRAGKDGWCVPYETKAGEKQLYFAKYTDCKKPATFNDTISKAAIIASNSRNTFESRLKAKICELCGNTDMKLVMHHVNKVKNLKGKEQWEQIMIAKNRKTMAVCEDCHTKIHSK
jgi:group II intron reverse transcriptase/maturase